MKTFDAVMRRVARYYSLIALVGLGIVCIILLASKHC